MGILAEQNSGAEKSSSRVSNDMRSDMKILTEQPKKTGIKFKASLDEDSRISENASCEAPTNHRQLIEGWLFRSSPDENDFKAADQEPFFVRKSPLAAYSRAQFSSELAKDVHEFYRVLLLLHDFGSRLSIFYFVFASLLVFFFIAASYHVSARCP